MGYKEKVEKSKVMLWLCVSYLLLFSPASLADYTYLSDLKAEREEARRDLEESRTDNEYSGSDSAHHTSSSRTDMVPTCTVAPPLNDCPQEMTEEALIRAEATTTRTSPLFYVLGALSVSIVVTASVLANGWRTMTVVLFQMLRWLAGVAMACSSLFWLGIPNPDLPQWTSYTITTIPGWGLLVFATAIATWLVWAWEWSAIDGTPLWPTVPVFGGLVLFTALLGDAAGVFLLLMAVAVTIGAFLLFPPLIFPAALAVVIGGGMIQCLAELTAAIAVPVSVDMLLVVLRMSAAVVVPVLGGFLLINRD